MNDEGSLPLMRIRYENGYDYTYFIQFYPSAFRYSLFHVSVDKFTEKSLK